MCLYIKLTQTLRKPLKVYKILTADMKSPIYDYQYDFNRVHYINRKDMFKDAELVDDLYTLCASFYRGYHSFTSLKEASSLLAKNERIFEAEIPAEAVVAFGNDKDAVSTALIIRPYCYIPTKIFGMTFYRRIKINSKSEKP